MITKFKLFEKNELEDYIILEVHYENGLPPGSYDIFESDDFINFKITSINYKSDIFGFRNNNIDAESLYEFLEKVNHFAYIDEDDYKHFLEKCLPEKYQEYLKLKQIKKFKI